MCVSPFVAVVIMPTLVIIFSTELPIQSISSCLFVIEVIDVIAKETGTLPKITVVVMHCGSYIAEIFDDVFALTLLYAYDIGDEALALLCLRKYGALKVYAADIHTSFVPVLC